MKKQKTVAQKPNAVIQDAPRPESGYIDISTPDGVARAGRVVQSYTSVTHLNEYEQTVSFQRDYSNILPGISSKPGFTREDYEYFRPEESIPTKHRYIMRICDDAYTRNGLIKNIIDLMGDFTVQGIRISHPNKKIERFHQNWFKKIGGEAFSERFANTLYRLANVIVKKQTAKLKASSREQLYKTSASPDLEPEFAKVENKEIPWKYSILHPALVSVIGGQLASFVGSPQYAITVPADVARIINAPSGPLEKAMVAQLPADIRQAAKKNTPFPLPQDKTLVFHYKKDDWDAWAKPITYSALGDIQMLDKLKLADMAALDGAITNIRIFKLGNIEARIAPSDAAISKLASILQNNVGAGVIDLIWGPDIELVESKTSIHMFLGKEKYDPTMRALYEAYGVPATLTGNGQGGTTNNYMSLTTLMERLAYGRSILLDFWESELQLLQKAMGFRQAATIEFDLKSLGDEKSEKALLLQLVDRNLMSDEVIQRRFGQNPDMENTRLKREGKEKDSGRRVKRPGPYSSPQNDYAGLQKIALQTGIVTPSEVGVELEEKKKGEKTLLQLQPKPAAPGASNLTKKKNKGRPGQGRPVGKKDAKKRKTKTFSPKSKAMIELWAVSVQEKISEIMNPAILHHFKKNNMRKLSDKEDRHAEQIKSSVLYRLEPLSDITEEVVRAALAEPVLDTSVRLNELCGDFAATLGKKPTKDDVKQLHAYIYADLQEYEDE